MSRVALLIVNGKSRSGKEALPQVLAGLAQRGITAVHRECEAREGLPAMIASEGAQCDLVIVGGGDGTLNAAAHGLIQLKKPLGILPLGTANDLARTLEIPAGLDEAMDVIVGGKTRAIDLGQVNDVLFFNVASIGLSAELAQRLTGDIKRRFGKLGYALTALRVLAHARPFRARIEGDGHHAHSLTLQVAVGNGRYYGGGNIIERDAAIDEEMLRLYSLEFIQSWRMVLMFHSFRSGEHGALKEVRTMQGKEFKIQTRRPKPVNADGEIVSRTPATFKVLPKAVEVIVP